jgi:hypothetical protein
MEMLELEITIGINGEVLIGVKGVGGPDCIELTRDLEEAIGKVTDRSFTQDYYEQEITETRRVKERLR